MQAALFFRVLKHGRKIYNREHSLFMADMCDVSVISHSFENYHKMREYFRGRALPETLKPKALPADDIRTAQIAAAMFRSAGLRLGVINGGK